jgi:hypothetical protein
VTVVGVIGIVSAYYITVHDGFDTTQPVPV